VKVKGSKWRKQPLTRGITEILVREREMVTNPDGWVFPNPSTKTGHMDRIVKAFRRTVVRAGMNPSLVTPHIMRHTAITRLAQSGADIKTIQEFSGHESLEMVMRYTHAQDRVVDEALDRMEGGTVIEHPRAKIPSNS
jgi:integrase